MPNLSRTFISQLLMLLLLAGVASLGYAEAPRVVVLYPENVQRATFVQIIEGIKERLGDAVVARPLEKNVDTIALQSWLAEQSEPLVIALGRRATQVARDINQKRLIIGAITHPSGELRYVAGVSIYPSPESLFSWLRALAPHITDVSVVYTTDELEWLIRLAERAASRHGFTLTSVHAEDARAAALFYRSFFETSQHRNHALWLLERPAQPIFHSILENAWRNRGVVLSNRASDVQRGALLTVYSKPVDIGRRIAEVAVPFLSRPPALRQGDANNRITPQTGGTPLVNSRTVKRLGLHLPAQLRQEIEFLFP
ncbi:hypothetical protein [Sulfuriflexus mobilis]|uniref:hypothetical protein n=1 Tax=Sulfuriflexus mobilis TaxID=1811807 RepID=UPI000F82950F|nr:hypothetical protein [Sulfuriflexus mobilis]